MHSEHLSNLHPGWAVGGWLLAVAVTAAFYLGGVGAGLVPADSGAAVWIVISMGVGFFAGGLVVGMRWSNAPILHGMAITFFSVFVWFGLSLTGQSGGVESVPLALGLILIQLVASCTGGWAGRRAALGGGGAE